MYHIRTQFSNPATIGKQNQVNLNWKMYNSYLQYHPNQPQFMKLSQSANPLSSKIYCPANGDQNPCNIAKRSLCNHCNDKLNKYVLLYLNVINNGYSYNSACSTYNTYTASTSTAIKPIDQ